MPSALDYYNRVLALDDGNPRVLAAVQRLGRRTALRRALLRRSAIACARSARALAGSASRFAHAHARAGEPRRVASRSWRACPAARAVERASQRRAPARRAPPTRAARRAPAIAPRAARAARAAPAPRPSAERAAHWSRSIPIPANVSIGIDGAAPRAFGPSFREVELEPGVHRFKFVGAHDCCIDEEVSVKVPPGDGRVHGRAQAASSAPPACTSSPTRRRTSRSTTARSRAAAAA